MTNIEKSAPSRFEYLMTKMVNELWLAYDEESEKRLKEDIKKIYKTNKIPFAGSILDMMETENYDVFHGITHCLLEYKEGNNILCYGSDKDCDPTGIGVCDECCLKDDCYDNVFCNDVQWEFGDSTFPIHLCNLLYSVLTDGDLCIYISKDDVMYHEDLASNYDYGNSEILLDYYESGNDKLMIVNHAQLAMFDDLYDRDDDGSCYNYGEFLLMLDPFERKRREEYYLEGGM